MNDELNIILNKMSHEEFWLWVSEWLDEQIIYSIIDNWDDDLINEEIKKHKI